MNSDPSYVLEHIFGYSEFRSQQKAIVEAVCQGKNALVVMPTGGGKSLCYQVPALCREGMAVVVSPLIALMQDQVNALAKLGVSAEFLNSSLSSMRVQEIENQIRLGEIQLLYVAPERLTQERTIQLLDSVNISLFAIDEAHCVAQWGHDFRVDYLKLDFLTERFPHIPRVALTATADSRTQKEIIERLSLDDDALFLCGFDRPNITYNIRPKQSPKKQVLTYLSSQHQGEAGIIYCLSRSKVESTAAWLKSEGFNALPYHAGLSASERQSNQESFLREDGVIIVATIAFGMGIDKPDVRFVLHLDMPKSIEAYYQETGRAGRDSAPSDVILFYGMEDVVKLNQMLQSSEGNENFKRMEQQRLNAMLGLCETISCRRQALLRYFGEDLQEPCGNCDNCLIPPETWGATEAVQKALSCVYRTQQRFGAAHVIDVLRGANTEKIRQFSHNNLSTYGIGSDVSLDGWRSVFRQLLVMGYLNVDDSGFGSLILSEKCRPLLRGEDSIFLRKEMKSVSKVKREKQVIDIAPDDMPLWHALRKLRKEIADEGNVPPYVVFSDATLKEMIYHRPKSNSEFLALNGVGDKKLEVYGETFLDLIAEFEYV